VAAQPAEAGGLALERISGPKLGRRWLPRAVPGFKMPGFKRPVLGGPHAAAASGLERGAASVPEAPVCRAPREELRCYEVLGLSREASSAEVRSAYRCKALAVHPDKHQGGHTAFLIVAEAFETLSNKSTREVYDRELAMNESRDGLSEDAEHQPAQPPSSANPAGQDSFTVCQALREMAMEDWSRQTAGLSTRTLEEMRAYLSEPGVHVATRKADKRGGADSDAGSPGQQTCLFFRRQNSSYCFWAEVCIAGISVRSKLTWSRTTAVHRHIAVVTLREWFIEQKRLSPEADVEAVFKAALAQAREQHVYLPGEQFAFHCRKRVQLANGSSFSVHTTSSHCLEAALAHRREVIALAAKGATKQRMQRLLAQQAAIEKKEKGVWQERCRATDRQLHGFITSELNNRLVEISGRGPMRLRGKQSAMRVHLGSVQLPWLSRVAAVRGMKPDELEAQVRAVLRRPNEVQGLRSYVQSRLAVALSLPLMPLPLAARAQAFEICDRAWPAASEEIGSSLKPNDGAAVVARCAGDARGVADARGAVDTVVANGASDAGNARGARIARGSGPTRGGAIGVGDARGTSIARFTGGAMGRGSNGGAVSSSSSAGSIAARNVLTIADVVASGVRQAQAAGGGRPALAAAGGRPAQAAGGGRPALAAGGGRPAPPPIKIKAVESSRPALKGVDQIHASPDSPNGLRDGSWRGRLRSGHMRGGNPGWRERCSCAIKEILSTDAEVNAWFGSPVNLRKYTDYLESIAPNRPVDLRLVIRRLHASNSGYATIEQCSKDIAMIWDNASKYNAQGSTVCLVAKRAANKLAAQVPALADVVRGS